jgi:hypothetical protein
MEGLNRNYSQIGEVEVNPHFLAKQAASLDRDLSVNIYIQSTSTVAHQH